MLVCICTDVNVMTMTQYNSSQRRLLTVHLGGLSILSHMHATRTIVGGSEEQQHNRNALMHALLTAAVLLSIMLISRSISGPVGDIVRGIVNLYTMTSASHSLKSSENVTLCQVRELGKRSFAEILCLVNYCIAILSLCFSVEL